MVGNQERDGVCTLCLDLLVQLYRPNYEGHLDSKEVLDQISVVQQYVVFEGPERSYLKLVLFTDTEPEQGVDSSLSFLFN